MADTSVQVVVLGASVVDITAQVKRLPLPDEIVLAETCRHYPGGSGGNVAVGLARLGRRVAFAGKMGADENGHLLLKSFEAESVNTQAVIMDPTGRTASCFIAIDEEGSRVIFALGGTALLEKDTELDSAILESCRVLYISDAYPEVALSAAAHAHQGGATVVFAPGGLMTSLGAQLLQPLLAMSDVLIASQREAEALIPGMQPPQNLSHLQQYGPKVVIETLGAEGAALMVEGQHYQIPPWQPQQVHDTTGAGDAFSAGLVHGHLEGLSWQEAASMGCAAAAIKIAHVGARSGLPRRSELLDFMSQ